MIATASRVAHVRRYHRHYGTSGHAWQGRFKAFPVEDDDHLVTVIPEGMPLTHFASIDQFVGLEAFQSRPIANRLVGGSLFVRATSLIIGVVAVGFATRRRRRSENAMRLNIKLPKEWASFDNPDGGPTYCRVLSETPGPLQISWAEYKGGALPNPSTDDLKRMAREFGEGHAFGELVESSSGPCEFGRMGSAIFRSIEYPRIQLWYLSNGRDFVMVTHIFATVPDAAEVREAQEIVRLITLAKKSKRNYS